MIKHAKPKNLIYYLKRLFLAAAIVFCCWQLWVMHKHYSSLNIENILENSELKNKGLKTKIKVISQDGLSAYFMEEHSTPIVSVSFLFRNSGTAHDAENKQGLANFSALLLTEGAGDFDSQKFKEIVEENGIKLGFSVSADDFEGQLAFPVENIKTAVSLLQEVLERPRLDENSIYLKKQQLLTVLQMQNENPQQVLANKFKEDIFAGHPYARNTLGKAEDIKTFTAADIRTYLAQNLAQDNLIVGIAGDLSAAEAKKLLEDLFIKLPKESLTKPLPKIDFSADGVEYNTERSSAQALTRLAAKGTFRDSADFYPLYLVNYIFGESGLSSRLSKKIREKEGLTYGVYTYLSISDAAALIGGGFSATHENFAKAQQMLKEEWLRLGEKGLSNKELNEAKNSLINSFYLRFANIDGVSGMLVSMQKYNLGLDFLDKRNDYVRNVSLKDANEAAKKYFSSIPDFVNIGVDSEEEK